MKYSLSIVILFLCLNAFSQKTIISTSPTLQDKFSKKSGNIRFTSMSLAVGSIMNNETKTDTIRILNSGAVQLHLALGKVPPHIEAHLSSAKLLPESEGWISVKYDASKRNDYGFVVDRFELVTDDSVQPVKAINVRATIKEYFPPMNADDSVMIQKARMTETSYDYGKIKQGDKVSHTFMLVNDGKRDLVIHNAKTTCTCLKHTISKNTIASGDTVSVKIDFDSKDKEGKDSRKLNLYLNDPSKPVMILEIKGTIIK